MVSKKKRSKITTKSVSKLFQPLNFPDYRKKNLLDFSNFEKVIIKKNLTWGQKASDKLTQWAGSWVFILLFVFFIIFWMALNVYIFLTPFDKFPFILLNLALSCLAALQAPIILMSQNRSNQRDRIRSEYDYAVNRKAEKEIRELQKTLNIINKKLNK